MTALITEWVATGVTEAHISAGAAEGAVAEIARSPEVTDGAEVGGAHLAVVRYRASTFPAEVLRTSRTSIEDLATLIGASSRIAFDWRDCPLTSLQYHFDPATGPKIAR